MEPMRLGETHDLFEQFEYPVHVEQLIAETGDHQLAAPSDPAETVGEALARLDATTVDSAAAAHHLLLGAVGDAYVGRKHYDDRAPNPLDGDQISF